MASGFLSGFAKGAVVATLALAALSLIAPQPKLRGVPQEAATKTQAPQHPVADVPAPAAETAPEASAIKADAPLAGTDAPLEDVPDSAPVMDLPLPAGSEFARGSDDAPRLPAPLTPAKPALPMDAPVVAAPAPEMQPVGTATPSARPQPEEHGPAAPSVQEADSAAIALPSAPLAEVPSDVPVAMQSPALEQSPHFSDSTPLAQSGPVAEVVEVLVQPRAEMPPEPSAQPEPEKSADFPLFLPPSINELIPSTN